MRKRRAFWRHPLQLNLYQRHDQIMTFTVEEQGQVQAFLSFVYAKCSVTERRELWQQLNSLSASINKPWLVGGDFNATLYAHEKLGGALPEVRATDDFSVSDVKA